MTRPAGGAHELAGGGLLVLGQRADLTVGEAQRGLLARVGEAHGLEFIEGRGGGDGGNGLVYGGGNGGFIQRVRDGGARQSFSHLLFLATSRIMPTARGRAQGAARVSARLMVTVPSLVDGRRRQAMAAPHVTLDGCRLPRATRTAEFARARDIPASDVPLTAGHTPGYHGLMTPGQRLRQIANLLNGSTLLGLLLAACARTNVSSGPRGLLIAGRYRWRLPFAAAFTVGNVILFRAGPESARANPVLLGHEERHSTQYAWCLGLPFLRCTSSPRAGPSGARATRAAPTSSSATPAWKQAATPGPACPGQPHRGPAVPGVPRTLRGLT